MRQKAAQCGIGNHISNGCLHTAVPLITHGVINREPAVLFPQHQQAVRLLIEPRAAQKTRDVLDHAGLIVIRCFTVKAAKGWGTGLGVQLPEVG